MPYNVAVTRPDSQVTSDGVDASSKAAGPRQISYGTEGVQLTPDQVRSFFLQGHLSLDSITTPKEIADMRAIIEDLFERRIGENEGAYGELVPSAQQSGEANSPQILNPVNYAPALHKTKCFANAWHIARQVLGRDARFFLDLSILKKPKVGVGTPWHQDAAYRDPRFEYAEVAIWVPLQDVRVESGCLHFISGSHKNPVIEHRPVNNDVTALALECTGAFDETAAVACPLPAGGCTIHLPGILHCAGPNVSDVPRLAYIMVFGIAPKPATELRLFPWLSNREPASQVRKRRWMRRGGMFITVWRRVRRGDLSSWRSVVYWVKRSLRTIARGG